MCTNIDNAYSQDILSYHISKISRIHQIDKCMVNYCIYNYAVSKSKIAVHLNNEVNSIEA